MTPADARAAFELPEELPKLPKVVSTGSLGLDIALGIGGWPLGQVSVIYGPAWCGKTTLALSTTAQMQKLGTVAYISLDGDFHPEYATAIGVDVSALLVLFDIPPRISGFPLDFMVVDSLSSDSIADQMAAIRIQRCDITTLAVSQTRRNITRGCDTPGYLTDASVRVRLSQDSNGVGATVTRNPWQPNQNDPVCFKIDNHGIDHTAEVFRLALQEGLIRPEGTWFYMGNSPLGQGRITAQRALQERPWLLERLVHVLRREISYRAS